MSVLRLFLLYSLTPCLSSFMSAFARSELGLTLTLTRSPLIGCLFSYSSPEPMNFTEIRVEVSRGTDLLGSGLQSGRVPPNIPGGRDIRQLPRRKL